MAPKAGIFWILPNLVAKEACWETPCILCEMFWWWDRGHYIYPARMGYGSCWLQPPRL